MKLTAATVLAILAICATSAVARAQADGSDAPVADPAPAPPPPAPPPESTYTVGGFPPPLQPAPAIVAPSTVDSLQAPTTPAGGVNVGDFKFAFHGYARMPLMTQGSREPYLVDNDYYLSGFAYTRLYEPDWSELRLSVSSGNYTAEFAVFASLYSDYAQADIADQLGVAQASVVARHFLDVDPLTVQVGVFWDKFGYMEPYDTYIFGRTHQGGGKATYALPNGGHIQAGLGVHEADLTQNLGMTPIAHVAGVYPIGPLELGAYVLRTWTRDKRQLSPIEDGTMYVTGMDAHYKLPHDRGTAYLAFGYYHMDHVLYLAPALEVMHSTGGRGLTENFLGLDSSNDGTGHMYTLATDEKIRIGDRAGVRVFGMATWVLSPQIDLMDPLNNKDARLYFKWGAEPSYALTPKIRVSARYDRVIMDVYDAQDSFHVLSPKISFPLDNWGEIFFQYSHYWYGDKIQLRPGQVPLETEPDKNVFKLQAQVVW